MIWKLVAVMLALIMIAFSFALCYQNLPQDPVSLEANKVAPDTFALIEYGAVPVFAEKLRFNHNRISYFIEKGCSDVRRDAMINAFSLFANEMKIISFYEVDENADIDAGCSDEYILLGDQLFAAGEGGPSRIFNTSGFKTIDKGEISLYADPRCDLPVVELHELGHVFGFDHSDDPKNIMYNTSNCDQRISSDMIKLINDLYSIEALADAVIGEVTAVRRGKYLDFNITVLNEGLIGIEDINLTIVADGEEVDTMSLGELGIGYGRTLKATNMKLPSRNIETIDFIIDKEGVVRELDEDNNALQMVVSSQ